MQSWARTASFRLSIALVVVAALAVLIPALASATPFSNTTAITTVLPSCVGQTQPSTPYPSNIVVSAQTGTITDVNVTLHGMNFWEGDFEVLLVGPSAQRRTSCSSRIREAPTSATSP